MSDRETQLHEGTHAPLDNQDRNAVRPQTQEAYGDQELAAETKVTHERHYAGQPLETLADRDANEEVRAERYERAKVDPLYAAQQKIDVDEEDRDEEAYQGHEPVAVAGLSGLVAPVPLASPVPDEVAGEDGEPEDLTEDELEAATAPDESAPDED